MMNKPNYLIYKNNDFELHSLDIVQLKNGVYVGVCHPQFFDGMSSEEVENNPIVVTTTPFSSHHSTIYLEHIDRVVAHHENHDDFCHWFFENSELVKGNGLFLKLEKEEK